MEKDKTQTIIIRIGKQLKTDLQLLADKDSRTLSDYIRVQLQKIVDSDKTK